VWTPIGLSRGATSTPQTATHEDHRVGKPPLCTQYPQVPGLCHMSESAGRMWVAKYKRDNRAVEAELARQERKAKVATPTMSDAISQHHYAP
jgi:hypothetical protein